MRKLAFYIVLQLFIIFAHATNLTIKTISIDGRPAYMIRVGAFPHENNALQLKLKLSSIISQSIYIEHQAEYKNYYVNIGPVNELQEAQELEKKLIEETQDKISPILTINKPSFSVTQSTLNTENLTLIPQILTSNNENQPPHEKVNPEERAPRKLWNLRGADIRAVIGEVSRVTGKNFIIDPRVQGKISITSSTPMSDKELYQVFLSMLQVSGYAAVPSGNVIKIVPNIEAKTISPDHIYTPGSPPRGDDMMVAVIPVHYVPAEQLVPVLRPLMPQWSSVSAYSPSNMLILSGRASNIKQLSKIIRQVDTSSSNGVDVVHLKHALAMDVAATMKDLIKTQAGAGGSHTQTMLAVDDRSNAILLSGSKTERIKLRLLIHQLDNQSNSAFDSNTQVIYLDYLRAEDLVPILAGIAQANFSGNVGTTIGTITVPVLDSTNPASNLANGSSSSNNSSATNNPPPPQPTAGATPNTSGAPTQNEGSTKPTVQIIAEPNTNSVIINAPASLIRILRAVIRQLDIRPAQLLIEALVAEVNENDVKNLGIEWGSNVRNGRPDSFRPGFAIISTKSPIIDYQAQIFALARQQKANILSTPSVVVLDNRQAKILVGKQVSVAASTYPNNASGTAAGSPYETFNRVNVALHLYVRPQITRGRGIQLQIDQGNDTIDPSSLNNTTNPTFDISSIVTSVHVESGDIVVLGGLIQNGLGNDNRKIPILGDIPGLGRFLQHNNSNHEKRVLMVFIRPVILRSERDAVEISGAKYNDIRQYELQMLRQEPYVKGNESMILPPLTQAKLPKPFCRRPKPLIAPMK
ncbi:MAG: GspD family T2SS secretin variant LspD [Tatlockia sp.]|nr:GspD family T2SS secretin variant LspD [Tatlockia sp.]